MNPLTLGILKGLEVRVDLSPWVWNSSLSENVSSNSLSYWWSTEDMFTGHSRGGFSVVFSKTVTFFTPSLLTICLSSVSIEKTPGGFGFWLSSTVKVIIPPEDSRRLYSFLSSMFPTGTNFFFFFFSGYLDNLRMSHGHITHSLIRNFRLSGFKVGTELVTVQVSKLSMNDSWTNQVRNHKVPYEWHTVTPSMNWRDSELKVPLFILIFGFSYQKFSSPRPQSKKYKYGTFDKNECEDCGSNTPKKGVWLVKR